MMNKIKRNSLLPFAPDGFFVAVVHFNFVAAADAFVSATAVVSCAIENWPRVVFACTVVHHVVVIYASRVEFHL